MELPKGERLRLPPARFKPKSELMHLQHHFSSHILRALKSILQTYSPSFQHKISLSLSLSPTQPTSGSLAQNGSSHTSPFFLPLVAQRVNRIARFKPTQVTSSSSNISSTLRTTSTVQLPPFHKPLHFPSSFRSTRNGRSFTKWKISLWRKKR